MDEKKKKNMQKIIRGLRKRLGKKRGKIFSPDKADEIILIHLRNLAKKRREEQS